MIKKRFLEGINKVINKNNARFVPKILDSFNDPPKLLRRTLIRRILENCAYPRHLCKSASFAYRKRMCVVAIALNGQISARPISFGTVLS